MAADISPFRLRVFPVIMAQTQVLLTSMGFCPLDSGGARPGLALRNTAKRKPSAFPPKEKHSELTGS